MRKPVLLTALLGILMSTTVMTGCTKTTKKDEYTKDGRLKISMRNLYFDDYAGGDAYLEELEKQFQISLELTAYDWANWATQVNGEITSGHLYDVFHANIDSYNFAAFYKFWAEEHMIKPLPKDLSQWPNLKKMIENTTNIESLKLGGELYGIPIAKNTTNYETTFSPFTYIYRRDWAKKYGVYQENDEYTWDQFQTLLETFATEFKGKNMYALGDVEWGFPSITNFYKQVPHCFAQDETGKYVNNYTTDAYIEGLEKSKEFKLKNWYGYPQNTASDGKLNSEYYGNKVGVLYENLSYDNFVTLKKQLILSNESVANFNVDDATAIMKIKGPDGKYVLEGTDNWFSMTFFDNKISDEKLHKLLDLYDWLLGEEGTRFSIFGIEGYDYKIENGEIKLIDAYWPKNKNGTYARKDNGGRYLRNMVSLGYDTLADNPLTDKDALAYLNAWEAEMNVAKSSGTLKVLKETPEVMWLTSEKKAQFSGMLRTEALGTVMKYIYSSGITTIEQYKNYFNNNKTWKDVLAEVNSELGK